MDKLVVRGRKRLTGEVTISGAKNAAVAVIPAAVMATGVSVLENLPSIEDVRNICHTIQEMGGKCRFLDKHTLEIDCNEGVSYQATFEGVQKMRSSAPRREFAHGYRKRNHHLLTQSTLFPQLDKGT